MNPLLAYVAGFVIGVCLGFVLAFLRFAHPAGVLGTTNGEKP